MQRGRSALVSLNIVGHFAAFRAEIGMHVRMAFWPFRRHLRNTKGNILRLSVTSQQRNATCMSAPYRGGLGGLGGLPALALLLQTSNKLILGAHDGSEGSVFLLQLPVVAGHLQGLSRGVLDGDAATSAVFQQGKVEGLLTCVVALRRRFSTRLSSRAWSFL